MLATIAGAQSLTTIKVRNPGAAKPSADLTFGMVFKAGDVPAGKSLSVSSGSLQVDAKATNADGSLRHAVLSLHLENLTSGEARTVSLSAAAPAAAGAAIDPADVLKTDFDAKVTLTIAGVDFTASARDNLTSASTKWLSGSQCTEWLVSAPLKGPAGAVQPQMHVRFAVRAYAGLKSIRADVSVENDWTYEPAPMGLTYDAKIAVGANVYTKAAIPHTHHARWRKVLWWGADPGLEYEYDRNYILATGAFPYYDKTVKINLATIAAMKSDFDPMSPGNLTSYMPSTGAHNDIGPLPDYAALYLLTMDPHAMLNVLANGNAGGSYSMHYRDKKTDLPVSLDDYPYMTILGNPPDTKNPKTGLLEAFPAVTNGLEKHTPDDAHQPSIAFLPYVISGDYFYLEELQFWANWNMVIANPQYREWQKGLLWWGQNRGQAWSMRTLGQAAYITPDSHPFKKYFTEKLNNNLAYYVTKYPNNPAANVFHAMEGHYPYPPFGMAPWMDDFFMWTLNYLDQLGFASKPILTWKGKFVVSRMTDPGWCWLKASIYELQVGPADKTFYKSWDEMFKADFPAATCTGTAMDGYPDSPTGYGANMQPALAAAVDAGIDGAQAAWDKYETRAPKQDYTSQPQFNVLPKAYSTVISVRGGSGRPAASGKQWVIAGSNAAFDLGFASEVSYVILDTIGRQIAAVTLGRLPKGRHALDWERQPGVSGLKPHAPYVIRIKAVDDFKHVDFPKVLSGARIAP